MSDLEILVPTRYATMEEARAHFDGAFRQQFPGGMMKWAWEDDKMVVSGPGAIGTITVENGHLVGRAQLKAPASMMRAMIEQKVRAALVAVAEAAPRQA
jgi:hypothetical protein